MPDYSEAYQLRHHSKLNLKQATANKTKQAAKFLEAAKPRINGHEGCGSKRCQANSSDSAGFTHENSF